LQRGARDDAMEKKKKPAYRAFVSGGVAAMVRAGTPVNHENLTRQIGWRCSEPSARCGQSSTARCARARATGKNNTPNGLLKVSPVPLSMARTLVLVYKDNGIAKGLYSGLSASLVRQAVYSSVRFGM